MPVNGALVKHFNGEKSVVFFEFKQQRVVPKRVDPFELKKNTYRRLHELSFFTFYLQLLRSKMGPGIKY
jgi:hypothetical protein